MRNFKLVELVEQPNFSIEAEVYEDRVLLIKTDRGQVSHVGLDIEDFKKLAKEVFGE